jgi:hypothetical protein
LKLLKEKIKEKENQNQNLNEEIKMIKKVYFDKLLINFEKIKGMTKEINEEKNNIKNKEEIIKSNENEIYFKNKNIIDLKNLINGNF